MLTVAIAAAIILFLGWQICVVVRSMNPREDNQ